MKEFSNVLVTGGAGFIGSYLVDRLHACRTLGLCIHMYIWRKKR